MSNTRTGAPKARRAKSWPAKVKLSVSPEQEHDRAQADDRHVVVERIRQDQEGRGRGHQAELPPWRCANCRTNEQGQCSGPEQDLRCDCQRNAPERGKDTGISGRHHQEKCGAIAGEKVKLERGGVAQVARPRCNPEDEQAGRHQRDCARCCDPDHSPFAAKKKDEREQDSHVRLQRQEGDCKAGGERPALLIYANAASHKAARTKP